VSVRCSDKEVKVINPAGRLEVRPESVKVCRGNSVVFTFSPKEPSKRANTKDSSGSTTGAWLTANGTTADGITIAVRPEVMPMEYKYTLEIEGLGLLDPRIVVQ